MCCSNRKIRAVLNRYCGGRNENDKGTYKRLEAREMFTWTHTGCEAESSAVEAALYNMKCPFTANPVHLIVPYEINGKINAVSTLSCIVFGELNWSYDSAGMHVKSCSQAVLVNLCRKTRILPLTASPLKARKKGSFTDTSFYSLKCLFDGMTTLFLLADLICDNWRSEHSFVSSNVLL